MDDYTELDCSYTPWLYHLRSGVVSMGVRPQGHSTVMYRQRTPSHREVVEWDLREELPRDKFPSEKEQHKYKNQIQECMASSRVYSHLLSLM